MSAFGNSENRPFMQVFLLRSGHIRFIILLIFDFLSGRNNIGRCAFRRKCRRPDISSSFAFPVSSVYGVRHVLIFCYEVTLARYYTYVSIGSEYISNSSVEVFGPAW